MSEGDFDRRLRQIASRATCAGELPGQHEPVALAQALRDHGLEVDPLGGPGRLLVRHHLGRATVFEHRNGRWTYRPVFDPTGGMRDLVTRTAVDLFTATEAPSEPAPADMWWDGRAVIEQGEYLGLDLETTPAIDGQFPQVVVASVASETGAGFLLEPGQIMPFLDRQLEHGPRQVWSGFNVAGFDWPVLEYRLPGFTERFHNVLAGMAKSGWFYDTMLLCKLWDIGQYGQLFRHGGALRPGLWADSGKGVYSLAAQSERWLGIRPPKGESLSFGDYLGRPRAIDAAQASYALGDAVVVAALTKRVLEHPFTQEVARRCRKAMLGLQGVMISFLQPSDWPAPQEDCVRLEGGLPDDGDPEAWHPFAVLNGARWGWQTHTIQALASWAMAWVSANGIEADVEHITAFLRELEADQIARMTMFSGRPGSVIVERGKSSTSEEQALDAGTDPSHWLPLVEQRIRTWKRKAKDRDKPVTLDVVRVPDRQFWRPWPGIVRTARHFPLRTKVREGDTLYVAADVTDDYDATLMAERFHMPVRGAALSPAGTQTGLSFRAGDTIRWDGTTWVTLEGDEAAEERQRILQDATTTSLMGRMVGASSDLAVDEISDGDDEAGVPVMKSKAFTGPVYPFVFDEGINKAAMEAYLRECAFPLPPPQFMRQGCSPIDQVDAGSEWYSDLIERIGLKRDQWLIVFGVKNVEDIPDPVLREYFLLRRTEKELGAVYTYLPGYAANRKAVQKLRLPQVLAYLGLTDVRRARVHPTTDACAAATTRAGQRNPNLQQVDTAPRHRGSFVARHGTKLAINDVGATEMATQAEIFVHRYGRRPEMRGRKSLADYLNEGYDPHYLTGMEVAYPEHEQVWMPILGDPALRRLKMASAGPGFDEAARDVVARWPEVKVDPRKTGEDNAKDAWTELLATHFVLKLGLSLEGEPSAQALVARIRQGAKPANFGIPGGMQANRLMSVSEIDYGVKITREQAETAVRAWKNRYADGKLWLEDGRQFLVRPAALPAPVWGYYDDCWCLTGMLRGQLPAAEPVPEWRLRRMLAAGEEPYDEGLNEWHNTQFQKLAADGAKLGAYFAVREGIVVVNFVHDELDSELPAGQERQQFGISTDSLKRGMCRVVTRVRLSIGGSLTSRLRK